MWRFAPLRSAKPSWTPIRFAVLKLAPLSLALKSFSPRRSAPCKLQPSQVRDAFNFSILLATSPAFVLAVNPRDKNMMIKNCL